MTTIDFPDDVARMVKKAAEANGYASVGEYVADLVSQAEPLGPELEAELLKGIASGSREITPAEWDAKRQALRDRMLARK